MDIHPVFDALEDDDLDAVDLIVNGLPRQVYERSDHFNDLDDVGFRKRFRLTKDVTLYLLDIIVEQLEFPYDTNNCVSPMNQLLTCLRMYATGTHLLCMADFAGMHASTVSRIVKRVSEAIAMQTARFIKFPQTPQEILETKNGFFNIAQFPQVVGALDCTHVKISSPGGDDAEVFRNRKQYFSLNVQAICNSSLQFTNIVARWPGSAHDSQIFNNSNICAHFEDGRYQNCVILGDSGYPLRAYLMTPILNPGPEAEQLYNESQIRTRNCIERCFGVWKRRFPILAYGCRLKVETTMTLIVAVAVLHNIAISMGDVEPPPAEGELDMLNQMIADGVIPGLPQPRGIGAGLNARAALVNNYFENL